MDLPLQHLALQTIAAWVTQVGLSGAAENDLLAGFCERAVAAGIPIARAAVIVDTLHPVHEGRVFRWRADGNSGGETLEYGRVNESAESHASWQRSPFYHLTVSGDTLLRRSRLKGDQDDFPILTELWGQGQTEYIAQIERFSEAGTIGEMDCIYASWTTEADNGFDDEQARTLADLFLPLALAMKCASLMRIAGTLVETYLGRDAGRRVLRGKIERGVADRVRAVLWFSDLRGFTRIADTASPEQIIPFLNEYAEAVVSAIHEAGGDVLKLIGDGTLAIFHADDAADACRRALKAEAILRARFAELNLRRAEGGQPVTDAYLGLHIGDVFYGNIGSHDRLDFTVIGPAVNMANRIATMCRSAERGVLMSSEFMEATPAELRGRIVSVGRYALRGFEDAEELFTLVGPERAV